VRQTLPLLTSYFALQMLLKYKTELLDNGINVDKIRFFHEPEVITSAYEIMDEFFLPPEKSDVEKWLASNSEYIINFYEKWVRESEKNPQKYLQVIRYEEINSFISKILDELREYLPTEKNQKIDNFNDNPERTFYMRKDPYNVSSSKLSTFLVENSEMFEKTVNRIEATLKEGVQ